MKEIDQEVKLTLNLMQTSSSNRINTHKITQGYKMKTFREFINENSELNEISVADDVISTSRSKCDLKDCLVTHIKTDNGDRYEIFKIGKQYRVMAFYKGRTKGEQLYIANPKERLGDIVSDVQSGYMR